MNDETEKIEPALTAEEWAKYFPSEYSYAYGMHSPFTLVREMIEAHRYHGAMAALNSLQYDSHPLKFTREDVRLIGTRIRTLEPVESHPGWTDEAAMWRALAAKLAAFLPPEE